MYLTRRVNSNGRTCPRYRQPIGGKIRRRQRMSNLFKSSWCLHCPGLSPPIPFSMHPGMEPSSKHRNLYLSHLSSTTVNTVSTGTDCPGHNTVDTVHTDHSTVVATTTTTAYPTTTTAYPTTTTTTRASVTTGYTTNNNRASVTTAYPTTNNRASATTTRASAITASPAPTATTTTRTSVTTTLPRKLVLFCLIIFEKWIWNNMFNIV